MPVDPNNPNLIISRENLALVDAKERSFRVQGSSLFSSWNTPVEDIDPTLVSPEQRQMLLKSQEKERERLAKAKAQGVVIATRPQVSAEADYSALAPVAPKAGFSLNHILHAPIFHWIKEAPRGWADVIIADPTIWRERNESWTPEMGFERTYREYEGRLYSLCAEFARVARNTGHLFLLMTGKTLKLKELGWNLANEVIPTVGDHRLVHYTRSKLKSNSGIAFSPCDLVKAEGTPFTTLSDDCIESILKACAQPGSNVFSPFAGTGTICQKAKAMGMFYVGVEKDNYSLHWGDLA